MATKYLLRFNSSQVLSQTARQYELNSIRRPFISTLVTLITSTANFLNWYIRLLSSLINLWNSLQDQEGESSWCTRWKREGRISLSTQNSETQGLYSKHFYFDHRCLEFDMQWPKWKSIKRRNRISQTLLRIQHTLRTLPVDWQSLKDLKNILKT